MLDDSKSPRIGSVSSIENPCVVVSISIFFGNCLKNHKASVQEHLGYCWAGQKGVFVDQPRSIHLSPVNFMDWVIIRQDEFEIIIKIGRENTKPNEAFGLIISHIVEILWIRNLHLKHSFEEI